MKDFTNEQIDVLSNILFSVANCMYKNNRGEFQENYNNFLLTMTEGDMVTFQEIMEKLDMGCRFKWEDDLKKRT